MLPLLRCALSVACGSCRAPGVRHDLSSSACAGLRGGRLHLAPGPCGPKYSGAPPATFFRAPITNCTSRHVSASRSVATSSILSARRFVLVASALSPSRAAVSARVRRAALVGGLYHAFGAGGGPHAGVRRHAGAGPAAGPHPSPHASKSPAPKPPVAMSNQSTSAGIRQQLRNTPVVGIGGSRAPGAASLWALRQVLPLVPARTPVYVGCASGIDKAVRQARPGVRVFRAASSQPGALARRSIRCVRAVAQAGGVWVSFPGRACPSGVQPSRSASACFSGGGSGSWASLALAAGLGRPCLVFLPNSIQPPAPFGLQALGRGWFWRVGRGQLRLL